MDLKEFNTENIEIQELVFRAVCDKNIMSKTDMKNILNEIVNHSDYKGNIEKFLEIINHEI